MSKKHDKEFKLSKLRKMLETLCKICDLYFIDLQTETSICLSKKYIDGSGSSLTRICGIILLSNNMKNLTKRYKTMLMQISEIKSGFWRNILINIPKYSSLEELELKLTIKGLI